MNEGVSLCSSVVGTVVPSEDVADEGWKLQLAMGNM